MTSTGYSLPWCIAVLLVFVFISTKFILPVVRVFIRACEIFLVLFCLKAMIFCNESQYSDLHSANV